MNFTIYGADDVRRVTALVRNAPRAIPEFDCVLMSPGQSVLVSDEDLGGLTRVVDPEYDPKGCDGKSSILKWYANGRRPLFVSELAHPLKFETWEDESGGG
jgi:hypothetical protein